MKNLAVGLLVTVALYACASTREFEVEFYSKVKGQQFSARSSPAKVEDHRNAASRLESKGYVSLGILQISQIVERCDERACSKTTEHEASRRELMAALRAEAAARGGDIVVPLVLQKAKRTARPATDAFNFVLGDVYRAP